MTLLQFGVSTEGVLMVLKASALFLSCEYGETEKFLFTR